MNSNQSLEGAQIANHVAVAVDHMRDGRDAFTSRLGIANANSAPGVSFNSNQQTLVSSILDLFAGHPSKEKFALWTDDALFTDPLTIAQGRKQYEAQWYGLAQAFSTIETQSHEVTSAGNPIVMNLRNKYTVKGIGKETTIQSVVNIYTVGEGEAQRIEKVEDKWDGKLPEGGIANAFRRLNAVTVPHVVSVPKDGEKEN
ncbi:hypothetical protein NA57DRAFT_69639 [Rhizodiscina lignyota]|uniref:SnoaL-like domain-containing protein n=1 Tax=Rhizodiscina lignyota TaxID=1504668 RepID=A0A9P4I604_9PEZI|nr:hypothetical protein NA57DRAFT_69639 [Rhizodiscina lignyota]